MYAFFIPTDRVIYDFTRSNAINLIASELCLEGSDSWEQVTPNSS